MYPVWVSRRWWPWPKRYEVRELIHHDASNGIAPGWIMLILTDERRVHIEFQGRRIECGPGFWNRRTFDWTELRAPAPLTIRRCGRPWARRDVFSWIAWAPPGQHQLPLGTLNYIRPDRSMVIDDVRGCVVTYGRAFFAAEVEKAGQEAGQPLAIKGAI